MKEIMKVTRHFVLPNKTHCWVRHMFEWENRYKTNQRTLYHATLYMWWILLYVLTKRKVFQIPFWISFETWSTPSTESSIKQSKKSLHAKNLHVSASLDVGNKQNVKWHERLENFTCECFNNICCLTFFPSTIIYKKIETPLKNLQSSICMKPPLYLSKHSPSLQDPISKLIWAKETKSNSSKANHISKTKVDHECHPNGSRAAAKNL